MSLGGLATDLHAVLGGVARVAGQVTCGRFGWQLPWGSVHALHCTPHSPLPTTASPPLSCPCPPLRASTELRIKYFDTIPTCTSLCLMRKGFLFSASEFGDHALYQFSVRTAGGRLLAAGWLHCSAPIRRPSSRIDSRDSSRFCSLGSARPTCLLWHAHRDAAWPTGAAIRLDILAGCSPSLPACLPQSLGDDDTEAVESSSATLMQTDEGYQVGGAEWQGRASAVNLLSCHNCLRSADVPATVFPTMPRLTCRSLPYPPALVCARVCFGPLQTPRCTATPPLVPPQPVFFDPRALTNLELLDRLDSLAPITDMKVGALMRAVVVVAAVGRAAVPGAALSCSHLAQQVNNRLRAAFPLTIPGGQPG